MKTRSGSERVFCISSPSFYPTISDLINAFVYLGTIQKK